MAPAAKKAKTAPAAPGGSGNLMKMFGAKPKAEDPKPDASAAPAEASAAPAAPAEAAAPTSGPAKGELSQEQMARIEENRRKALELRAKKRALEEGSANQAASSTAAAAAAPPANPSPAPASPAAPVSAASPPRAAAAGLFGAAGQAAASPSKAAASGLFGGAGPAAAKAKAKGKAKAKAGPFGAASLSPSADPAAAAGASPRPQAVSKEAQVTPEKSPPPEKERQYVSTQGGKFESLRCEEWKQYTDVYASRLKAQKGLVSQSAKQYWSQWVPPEGFRPEISGHRQLTMNGQLREVVLIGIIFKDLKTRPNVIEQFRSNKLSSRLISEDDVVDPGCLCSDDDGVWIEDASMRLQLELDPKLRDGLFTGAVVAVRGTPTAKGALQLAGAVGQGLLFAGMAMAAPRPLAPSAQGQPSFLALVSGLAPVVKPDDEANASHAQALERLLAFLAGGAGGEVKRLMVCGGTLCSEAPAGGRPSKAAIESGDAFLARLAAAAPVLAMPGRADPTNASLPQMPLHPHLFKKSRSCTPGAFRCVSNPYQGTVDGFGFNFLGHSGQPVQDILRSTRGVTALGALRMCLEAMHLAPTAPDTLSMPPLQQEDPFVLGEVPHVFFSGGHAKADKEWYPAPRGDSATSGTQLVCVPAFCLQPSVVLVNLHDPRDVRVQDLSC